MKFHLITLYLILFAAQVLFAEGNEVYLKQSTETIVVDGNVSMVEWQNAAKVSRFFEVQPGENLDPIVKTNVFVTQDETGLYFGFVAYCDPSEIRANLSKRDDIFQDDFVGVVLDPYGEGNRGFQIFSNPLGIQGDMQKTERREDSNYDVYFLSAGRITEIGYEVEIALPFSSIRFPESKKEWKINFFRAQPRSDARRQFSWMPHDRGNPCELCQLGTLKNVNPGKSDKRKTEWLPGLTANRSGSQTGNDLKWDKTVVDPSLGLKTQIGSEGILEITLNPDFSQIEADEDKIEVNSQFAILYREKRPFFNEGSHMFKVGGHFWKPRSQIIHTRTINNPLAAIKYIDRAGDLEFGYVGALDEESVVIVPFEEVSDIAFPGRSMTHLYRFRKSKNDGSYIGGLVNRRSYETGSNTVFGSDGLIRFSEKTSLDYQYFLSETTEPYMPDLTGDFKVSTFGSDEEYTAEFDGESFSGKNVYLNLSRMGRNLGLDFVYNLTDPEFRADNGFIQNSDKRNFLANIFLVVYPNSNWIESMTFDVGHGKNLNTNWEDKGHWTFHMIEGKLFGQTSIELMYLPSKEKFQGNTYTGLYSTDLSGRTKFGEWIQFGFGYSWSRAIIRFLDPAEIGVGKGYNGWVAFNPGQNLNINVSLRYSDSHDETGEEIFYKGYLSRFKMSYQFTRDISFKTLLQKNEFSSPSLAVQNLLSYQPNPFTIVYAGFSLNGDMDGNNGLDIDSRYIFFKFQYLLK